MEKKVTKAVNTRCDEESEVVATSLTLDFSGLTDAEILEYAVQTCVIRWQASARKKAEIPLEDTYTVPKPGTKGAGVITKTALIKRLFGDKADALIAKYGDEDKAFEAIKALVDDETDNIE